MKPITREWVEKAEADYGAALLLRRSRRKHSRDIVAFHLQQCAEKYFKARLAEASIAVPKTHDLACLLDLLLPVEPLWATLRTEAISLTNYAVEVRYPGRSVSAAETTALLRAATRIRSLARSSLGCV